MLSPQPQPLGAHFGKAGEVDVPVPIPIETDVQAGHFHGRQQQAQAQAETGPGAAEGEIVAFAPGQTVVDEEGSGEAQVGRQAEEEVFAAGQQGKAVLQTAKPLILAEEGRAEFVQGVAAYGVGSAQVEVHVLRYIATDAAGLQGEQAGQHQGMSGGDRLKAAKVEVRGPVVAVSGEEAAGFAQFDLVEPASMWVAPGVARVVSKANAGLQEMVGVIGGQGVAG